MMLDFLDAIENRFFIRSPKKDRLLANGVAASAARRKTGGLQWGGFPWGS
jgi:hypothetical protein